MMIDPAIVERLMSVNLAAYFNERAMPSFVEPAITELVEEVRRMSVVERERLLASWPRKPCAPLGWFARKMAGRAVREGSRDDLENALTAILLDAEGNDWRDLMAPLALVYDAAGRLGLGAPDPFLAMCVPGLEKGRRLAERLVSWPEENRAIGVFGFRSGEGPDGFDYVPLLPEYGGPSPL